jgi:aromatase
VVSTIEPQIHLTEHSAAIDASPATVYRLIADVSQWPHIFGPTVHVELLEERAGEQLMQIWALAHGRVRTWTSRRTLDENTATITFRQTVPAAPVAAMGGEWCVRPADGGGCLALLRHDFRAVGDAPDALDLIRGAVNRNSEAELAALKTAAESGAARGERQLTFSDSVRVDGAAGDVFRFLDRAGEWPRHLPHVARVDLTEEEPGIQHMEMDTRSPDGGTHTTASVRVCFPARGLIVYKQLRLPPVMTDHTGRWEVEEDGGGVVVTSWHTVTLSPEGVRRALGPTATIAEAREKVRQALGANSSITLRHAKEFAESRRRQ